MTEQEWIDSTPIGAKFGSWTVLSFSHLDKRRKAFWNCKCSCGFAMPICKYALLIGRSSSCRICCLKGIGYDMDLVGHIYGRLTVVSFFGKKNGRPFWNCLCACGNEKIANGEAMRGGITKSCGCLAKEVHKSIPTTHGMSKNPIYAVWSSMVARCHNKKNTAYSYYGGRGIFVCKRWHKFKGFYKDMGDSYKAGLTLERIDVDKGYSKSNCTWIPKSEQTKNTRRNVRITIDGETKLAREWSKISGIKSSCIYTRIKNGWTHRDAVFHPFVLQKNRKNHGRPRKSA